MALEKIKFKKDGGPITLEITSGFSSLGSFLLLQSEKSAVDFKEFGKDPKKIDDDIPDLFLIPIDLQKLENHLVAIIGKYRPAPGHRQIKVTYTFVQNNNSIHETEIKETSDEMFKRFRHVYEFESN